MNIGNTEVQDITLPSGSAPAVVVGDSYPRYKRRFEFEETTIDLHAHGFLVRVWVENNYQAEYSGNILDDVKAACEAVPLDQESLAVRIANHVPNITTVQVIRQHEDGTRVGVMIYTVPV
jgi:hypothetical protein